MTVTTTPGLSRPPSRDAGFSLIELIVVITIIGILAATVVVNVTGRGDDARIARAKVDIQTISQASSFFKLDHGRWPDTLDELLNPPEDLNNNVKTYLERRPLDPWNQEYYFELTDRGVRIYTYGGDKTEGGEGVNGDIFSDDE